MNSKEFLWEVKKLSPDILFIDVPTISFPLTMRILRELKEEIGCKISLIGGHVTALSKEVMQEHDFVDYCLLAECILTVRSLVIHETDNTIKIEDIKGITYRKDKQIKINVPEIQHFNIDDLPYPDRDDFPIKHYHDFEVVGRPSAQMLTSLGCPYKCSFCMPIRVLTQDASFYRKRLPLNIVDEMSYLKDEHNAKSIYFDDDTFSVDRKRLTAICDEIIQRKLDIPWAAMGDITIDKTTLEYLVKAGCGGIKFGVETANPDTIKVIKKNFLDHAKVKKFVEWCKDLGIWSHATFIIGLPGDNRNDILDTIQFAKDLDCDSVQFSIATPFPGTPFYKDAKEKGWLISDDWTKYDGANYSVLSYPGLNNEEIEELHRKALKSWYFSTLIREGFHPRRLRRIIKSRSVLYATRKTLSHLRGTL